MATLWILAELGLGIAVVILAKWLRDRRLALGTWVLAGYAAVITLAFVYAFWSRPYTLYGSLLYGFIVGGFHVILVGGLLLMFGLLYPKW